MPNTPRLGLHSPVSTDPADVPADMATLTSELDIMAPIGSGLLSNRPTSSVGTPGIRDRFYYATDAAVLYRDTGTGWVVIGPYTSMVAQGSFIAPAVTGLQTITGLGFQPKKVSFQWLDVDYAFSTRSIMGRGGMTAGHQFAAFAHMSETGVGNSTMVNDRAIISLDANATLRFSAAYSAMLPDGFRLNWVDVFGSHNLNVEWEAWG